MPNYIMGVLTQFYAAQTSLFEFTCMLHNNVKWNPWTNHLGCLLMSITTNRVELIRFSWSYSSTAWTFPMNHPQKKKSSGFRSDECGGQTTEPPQPIHVFWKWLSNQICTLCEKWDEHCHAETTCPHEHLTVHPSIKDKMFFHWTQQTGFHKTIQ
jgi:hypothetical protein